MGLFLFLSVLAGRKKRSARMKRRPYECGIIPDVTGRVFLSRSPFIWSAVFFLIFDVEAAFIFSWAVAFTDLGWTGGCRFPFSSCSYWSAWFTSGRNEDWSGCKILKTFRSAQK